MDDIENSIHELQDQQSDHEDALTKVQADLEALRNEFYRNNFPASQDFQKASNFNTSLRIPVNASLPATCTIGQVCSSSGKLYVCSALNTWTVAGTQS